MRVFLSREFRNYFQQNGTSPLTCSALQRINNDMETEVLIIKLRAQVKVSGNQKRAAEALGISPQYMTDLLKGRRMAGDNLLEKLGLRKKLVRA